METIFKKGDKVFDIRYGWGVVTFVNILAVDWPIEVLFDGEEELTDDYTFDGRAFINYPPTLSFTEYTLEGFSQERPEELPKKGDICWVRDDDDDDWVISHFMDYKLDKTFPYGTSIDMTNGSRATWRQMTTKKPYANEHN